MLVLSRKVGEIIVLDDTIMVSVVAVEGTRVKIGIQAPLNVHIVREELVQRNTVEPLTTAAPVGGTAQ